MKTALKLQIPREAFLMKAHSSSLSSAFMMSSACFVLTEANRTQLLLGEIPGHSVQRVGSEDVTDTLLLSSSV